MKTTLFITALMILAVNQGAHAAMSADQYLQIMQHVLEDEMETADRVSMHAQQAEQAAIDQNAPDVAQVMRGVYNDMNNTLVPLIGEAENIIESEQPSANKVPAFDKVIGQMRALMAKDLKSLNTVSGRMQSLGYAVAGPWQAACSNLVANPLIVNYPH